jgi:hypothetical protein
LVVRFTLEETQGRPSTRTGSVREEEKKKMGSPLKKQFNYSSSDLPCAGCQEFFVETDVPWGSKEKRWHHQCFGSPPPHTIILVVGVMVSDLRPAVSSV